MAFCMGAITVGIVLHSELLLRRTPCSPALGYRGFFLLPLCILPDLSAVMRDERYNDTVLSRKASRECDEFSLLSTGLNELVG